MYMSFVCIHVPLYSCTFICMQVPFADALEKVVNKLAVVPEVSSPFLCSVTDCTVHVHMNLHLLVPVARHVHVHVHVVRQ